MPGFTGGACGNIWTLLTVYGVFSFIIKSFLVKSFLVRAWCPVHRSAAILRGADELDLNLADRIYFDVIYTITLLIGNLYYS